MRISARPIPAFTIITLVVLGAMGFGVLQTPAAEAAITLRGTASTAAGAAGTVTLTKPATTAQYDVLIVDVAFAGGTGTVITATGWSPVTRQDSTTVVGHAIYQKIAGASEPATYAITYTPPTAKLVAGIVAYSGVDSSDPVDAAASQANGASTSVTAPAVTTDRANDLLLGFFTSGDGRSTFTPPGSMTERFDVNTGANNEPATEGADEQLGAAGSTGTRAATASRSKVNVGSLVALQLPTVAFSAATSSGLEGVTPASLAVQLPGASSRTVTVDYAVTGGTATGGGVDYTLASGTLTFSPGTTSQAISITIVEDSSVEPDETIQVTLSSPVDAVLGATSVHTFTITNDDPRFTVAADPVLASGAASTGQAWGDWIAAPGASDVNSSNYLKITNSGPYATQSFTIDFTPSVFTGADTTTTFSLNSNIKFDCQEATSGQVPSGLTFDLAGAAASGTGSIAKSFTATGNVYYCAFLIVALPDPLVDQTYQAAFTVV